MQKEIIFIIKKILKNISKRKKLIFTEKVLKEKVNLVEMFEDDDDDCVAGFVAGAADDAAAAGVVGAVDGAAAADAVGVVVDVVDAVDGLSSDYSCEDLYYYYYYYLTDFANKSKRLIFYYLI